MTAEAKEKTSLEGTPYEHLSEPPNLEAPTDHKLWPAIKKALKEVYDPEIPVNIYELGLIYKVEIAEEVNGVSDVKVLMTLTSPACPVAQEMPGWVQNAIFPIEGVGQVDVEIIWEPTWSPAMMAETAKMELNMFY
jgi:FeS assembly SUF system protein